MPASSDPSLPAVSVILPTYNRARFLPRAIESICSQTFSNWEMIVVDDGSTDDTAEVIGPLTAGLGRPMRYVRQENQGAYGARNTGVGLARGRYIAFFDSDDVWLPHHLADCAAALEAYHDIHWVFGATRLVDHATGRTLEETTFHPNGRSRPFLSLKCRTAGRLHIIEDPDATRCQILHGLYCGLQNSLIRRELCDRFRFVPHLPNAQDQMITIRALKAGYRLAYYDNVHVLYHVHGENSSGAALYNSVDKRLRVLGSVVRGLEELERELALSSAERVAFNQRISDDLFWQIGYSTLLENGRQAEALGYFRRGLKRQPTNWRYWKTYALATLKSLFIAGGTGSDPGEA